MARLWNKIDTDLNGQIGMEEFVEGSRCIFGKPKYSWMLDFLHNNGDDFKVDAHEAAHFIVD